MKNKLTYGIFLAILAAALYAVNSPFSKLLLDYMPSTLMAGFLYVGAGLGMGVIALIRKQKKIQATEESITKAELPHTIAMIVLDIAAPIFLLIGLDKTTAANASLPRSAHFWDCCRTAGSCSCWRDCIFSFRCL